MLNKTAIIPIFVIVIIVIGALGTGSYFVFSGSNNSSDVSANASVDADIDVNVSADVDVKVPDVDIPSIELAMSDWCVKGQTYSISQDGASSSTIIDGIESYKGSDWCKGTSKTIIQVPGGYAADIEAITTYYFNYGGKEVWVVSNVNGQTSEVHVTN